MTYCPPISNRTYNALLFWSHSLAFLVWFRLSLTDLTQFLGNIGPSRPLPPFIPATHLPPSGSMLRRSRDLSYNWCVSRFNREEIEKWAVRLERVSWVQKRLERVKRWTGGGPDILDVPLDPQRRSVIQRVVCDMKMKMTLSVLLQDMASETKSCTNLVLNSGDYPKSV